MTLRFVKTTVAILLGFVLVWQSVSTVSLNAGVTKSKCCCSGCDSKHCSTPACCVKPADNRLPFAPASLPTPPSNELQALAAPVASIPALPFDSADELATRFDSSVPLIAIPLFKRDCSYLI